MTVIDYHNRRIPEYYDTMYMDGYEPWEILEAVHKSMRRMLAEREAENLIVFLLCKNTISKLFVIDCK